MKRIKKEIVVFLLVSCFVLIGLCSIGVPKLLASNVYRFIKGETTIEGIIDDMDSRFSKRLSYHDELMDFNSFIMRITGTKYVQKSDGETIIRAENNYLTKNTLYVEPEELEKTVHEIKRLQDISEESGADFLYVLAPQKNYDLVLPKNAENYNRCNYNNFSTLLKNYDINCLDLVEQKEKSGISTEEMFFVTDHHWRPEYGFWANRLICERLSEDSEFDYDEKTTDLNNYDVVNYEKWSLGSYGKKVGSYFSPLGVDDIKLITPKFDTSLIEEQPNKNEKKEGNFTETLLEMSFIENKDYYEINAYATYTGGDFRLQTVTNNMSVNDKKILVIRDSFACPVTPFLSLNAKEMYIVDIRNYEYYIGEKQNLEEVINEIDPDYVIVIYAYIGSLDNTDGAYDFF